MLVESANVGDSRYVYLQDLKELDAQSLGSTPISWSPCLTPVRLDNWAELLSSHPDREYALYIQTGLSSGFRVGCNRHEAKLRPAVRNHPSASANPSVVTDYIQSECKAGRMVGPL